MSLPLGSGEKLLQLRGGSEAGVPKTPKTEPGCSGSLGVDKGVTLKGESVWAGQVTLAVACPAGLAGEPLPIGAQEAELGE